MLTVWNILVGSGHADKAAIVSAAGDSVWATSPNFEVSFLGFSKFQYWRRERHFEFPSMDTALEH